MLCSTDTKTRGYLTTHAWRSIPTSLMAGVLMIASAETKAVDSNFRVKENYSHPTEQLGSELTTPKNNLSAYFMKHASATDFHPPQGTQPILWFGSDIWVSNIGALLYIDSDQDGYFSGFSLTIDADTDYSQADVYATIDIQESQGDRERLHTTGTFSLYGNSVTDEYRIDIELVRNYPIGEYDLFVNLVDANNHAVVDAVSKIEFSNLSQLPLESEELDNSPPPVTNQTSSNDSEIRVVEYSGAGSRWLLLALGIPFLARRLMKPAHQSAGK